jgi:hypothetical protein
MCCCPRKGRCGLRHWPGAAAAALGAARAGKAGKAKAAGRVAVGVVAEVAPEWAWGWAWAPVVWGARLRRTARAMAVPRLRRMPPVGVECGLRIE